jgi:hypothetical protein
LESSTVAIVQAGALEKGASAKPILEFSTNLRVSKMSELAEWLVASLEFGAPLPNNATYKHETVAFSERPRQCKADAVFSSDPFKLAVGALALLGFDQTTFSMPRLKNKQQPSAGVPGLFERLASLEKMDSDCTILQRVDHPGIDDELQRLAYVGGDVGFGHASVEKKLAEFMTDVAKEAGFEYGPVNAAMTITHVVQNVVSIVMCSDVLRLFRSARQEVEQSCAIKYDLPDSATFVLEAKGDDVLAASMFMQGKHRVEARTDPKNPIVITAPATSVSTLTLYGPDELQRSYEQTVRGLAEGARPTHANGDDYRYNRVAAALYLPNGAAGPAYVYFAFHFKDPKHDWWSLECARLCNLWFETLENLCPGATVVMGGDTNLPTIAATWVAQAHLFKLSGGRLSMGNDSAPPMAMFSGPRLGIAETSNRRRNAAFSAQFSKVACNGIGLADPAAKVVFVVASPKPAPIGKAGFAMIAFVVFFLAAALLLTFLPHGDGRAMWTSYD